MPTMIGAVQDDQTFDRVETLDHVVVVDILTAAGSHPRRTGAGADLPAYGGHSHDRERYLA